MKKLLLLVVFTTLISCSKDEFTQEPSIDCDCDRVVEKLSFNIPNGNVITTVYKYTTINDCTGIQRESSLTTQVLSIGDCKQ